LTERRNLVMAMLEAVYVDTAEEKSVVAIQPKPAYRPLLETAKLTAVSRLSSGHAARTLESRMKVMSNYDSVEELDAATDAHRSIFANSGQYMTGQPLVRSGEIVTQVDGKNPISNIEKAFYSPF